MYQILYLLPDDNCVALEVQGPNRTLSTVKANNKQQHQFHNVSNSLP